MSSRPAAVSLISLRRLRTRRLRCFPWPLHSRSSPGRSPRSGVIPRPRRCRSSRGPAPVGNDLLLARRRLDDHRIPLLLGRHPDHRRLRRSHPGHARRPDLHDLLHPHRHRRVRRPPGVHRPAVHRPEIGIPVSPRSPQRPSAKRMRSSSTVSPSTVTRRRRASGGGAGANPWEECDTRTPPPHPPPPLSK
jgi:hypothetical protein